MLKGDTIFISGNFNPTATFSGGDYITTGATIDFNGFNSQTIPPFHYDNLIISGARDTDNVTLTNSDTIFIAGIFSPIMTFTTGNVITSNATSSNQAVALGQFDCLKNENGYTKLPNGLIMQWGVASDWFDVPGGLSSANFY